MNLPNVISSDRAESLRERADLSATSTAAKLELTQSVSINSLELC
jgi:hypothetical protein